MKQAWEDLGTEYEASSSVAIGDCDCTQHQSVCSKHGVSGYPTIKYWNAGDKEGKKYSGGRSISDLKKFVEVRAVCLRVVSFPLLATNPRSVGCRTTSR
eukprot:1321018-Rhodomonas_salina.1